MTLNDKTRLVICEDRPAFMGALYAYHEHLVFHLKDPEHTEALCAHMAEVRNGLHADLSTISNAGDPSLGVQPEAIVSVWLHATLDHAVLQFLYKAADGSPTNVAIRLDPYAK